MKNSLIITIPPWIMIFNLNPVSHTRSPQKYLKKKQIIHLCLSRYNPSWSVIFYSPQPVKKAKKNIPYYTSHLPSSSLQAHYPTFWNIQTVHLYIRQTVLFFTPVPYIYKLSSFSSSSYSSFFETQSIIHTNFGH